MIIFSKESVDTLFEEAKKQYPSECCGFCLGIRAGSGRVVKMVFPVKNMVESDLRNTHFEIPTDMILYAEYVAEKEHCEIIGIYHSHTDAKAVPSEEDSVYAIPGMSYPIVSVKEGKIKDFRSWEMKRGPGSEIFVAEEIEMKLM
jgi:proteasome lid subunit RPN8/RPN11